MEAPARAIAAIDAANGHDPNLRGGEPLALVQGRLAESWVTTLDPDASPALRLAARAHHLRRWVVPRADYPEGRAGYLRWRRDQKTRHASELTELLTAAGVDSEITERAALIVAKKGLGSDPEVQTFEDAVSLTFLQTQLDSTIDKVHDDDRMVEVLAKTLAKMSEAGRTAAHTIEVDEQQGELVARAVAVFAADQGH